MCMIERWQEFSYATVYLETPCRWHQAAWQRGSPSSDVSRGTRFFLLVVSAVASGGYLDTGGVVAWFNQAYYLWSDFAEDYWSWWNGVLATVEQFLFFIVK